MTPEQELLSAAVKAAFRLNGQVLEIAETLSRPAGLTAASWQVLGAVLQEPIPVAAVAREVGVTRQSVQRLADILVERGLAAYQPNPAHRRAKLLSPTADGRNAVRRIGPAHAAMARRVVGEMGLAELDRTYDTIVRFTQVMAKVAQERDATPVSVSAARIGGQEKDPGRDRSAGRPARRPPRRS